MHIELLSITATQPNTGAAGTAVGTDSLTIKNGRPGADIDIIAAWGTNQVAGFDQLIFPTAHDTTRGFRANAPAQVNSSILPFGRMMPVTPQELLAPTIAGSNTAGDVEQFTLLLRYKDFPGINARLIGEAELNRRTEKLTTIENSLASTAGPSYGTPETFNADSDLLIANRDYAILGLCPRTAVNTVYVQTPDGGNVRFGAPGILRQEITSQWFVLLSRVHGENLIPVFNSGNKNQCFIGVTTDENAGTFVVDIMLALLK